MERDKTKATKMHAQLINILCCPNCKGELSTENKGLYCKACSISYGVNKDIPIMIDLDKLPEHLTQQVKYFEKDEDMSTDTYKLSPWQKRYVERFENNFGSVKDKVIIDCGTGSGYMAIELAKKGAYVIACDLTLKVLLRLKKIAGEKNLDSKIVFVCCTAEDLPFKNKTCDFFISNAVLEHLPKETQAISEIKRVCRDNCGVMVVVPLKYKYLNQLYLPLNLFHDKRIGHLRRYDEIDIKRKFSDFIVHKTYYTVHSKKVGKVVVNTFIKDYFDEDEIEQEDKKLEKIRNWASNICVILKRIASVEKKGEFMC